MRYGHPQQTQIIGCVPIGVGAMTARPCPGVYQGSRSASKFGSSCGRTDAGKRRPSSGERPPAAESAKSVNSLPISDVRLWGRCSGKVRVSHRCRGRVIQVLPIVVRRFLLPGSQCLATGGPADRIQ
jgi:hypothetical protein